MSGISSMGASTSKGLSGLVSGLDTESMVEKLLSGTQKKIDDQKAQKQILLWKQEDYREIISAVKNLKDNYFDFLNPKTNISSNGFFQSMSSSVNSDCLSVIATTDAQQGNFTIEKITQVATSARLKSENEVTSDIMLNFNQTAYDALGGKEAVLKLNIDGIEKEITLDTSKPYNEADIKQTIEDGLQGTGVTVSNTLSGLVLDAGTRQVTMYADDQNYLDIVGVESGTCNQIDMKMSLKDINFATKLQGSQFHFAINDVEFNFNENDTIGKVIDEINSSDAGVEIKYSSVEDKFVISSKETGAGHSIDIDQNLVDIDTGKITGTGNLMTALFGDDAAQRAMNGPIDVNGGKYTTTITADADKLELLTRQGGQLKLTVDGRDYTFTLDKKADGESDYTAQEITDELNKKLKSAFGTKPDGTTAKVSFELGANDEISLNYEPGTSILFNNTGEDTDLCGALGLTNDQVPSSNVKLTGLGFNDGDTITVNGTDITVDGTKTLDDLIGAVASAGGNLSFDEQSRALIVEGNITISSSNKDAMKNLFGSEEIDLANTGTDVSARVVEGTNAKFTVTTDDGTDINIEKNVNSFTIDGLSITLNKATDAGSDPIEITTTRDTEQILDGIVKFVNDYNKTIDKLNGKMMEEPSYLDYPPLTDKQRDELSESEVKLWEEKSKEGLLRGDKIINDLLTEMRGVLYSKPEDAKLALYDIGITTTNDYKDGGKLVIKEDVLKNAIENNATDLQKFFASEDGIAKNFDKVMNKYIKSSVTSPGRLVEKAGIKAGFSESRNHISKQIDDVEKGLKNLERRYEMESSRYWKQFSSMEQLIQQMNSQSSWLMQQFG